MDWIFHQRSGVGAHISQTPKNEIIASEVSIAELTYGAVHSQNVEKYLREPQIIKENFQVLPIVKDWIDDYVEYVTLLQPKVWELASSIFL